VADKSASIDHARLNVLRFEPGIALEDGLRAITGAEHTEDMFHCQPMPPNNRLPAEDLRVDRNPLEKLIFLWNLPLHLASLKAWRTTC